MIEIFDIILYGQIGIFLNVLVWLFPLFLLRVFIFD